MSKGTEKITALFTQFVGNKAGNIRLGHGSFITMEFGKTLMIKNEEPRGEWYFWIQVCAWRLNKNNKPLCASSDSERRFIEETLAKLNNKKLLQVSVLNDNFDLEMLFENNLRLLLFSHTTQEYEHWMLYTPDSHVFIAGPGNKWSYELEHQSV